MAETIEVLVPGGQANPGPPLGPELGPTPVDVQAVVGEINDRTAASRRRVRGGRLLHHRGRRPAHGRTHQGRSWLRDRQRRTPGELRRGPLCRTGQTDRRTETPRPARLRPEKRRQGGRRHLRHARRDYRGRRPAGVQRTHRRRRVRRRLRDGSQSVAVPTESRVCWFSASSTPERGEATRRAGPRSTVRCSRRRSSTAGRGGTRAGSPRRSRSRRRGSQPA